MTDFTAVFEPVWTVSLLPDNSTAWERVLSDVDGQLVARDPLGLIGASRSSAESPLAWLPYLAVERSVDEFSGLWSEEQRRAIVAGSFAYHQVKGTRPALERALQPLDYAPQVVEWFERTPLRAAYTFTVRVELLDDRPWTPADRSTLVRLANGAKNAHTKLEEIEVVRRVGPSPVYVGGYARRRRTLLIRQETRILELSPLSTIYSAGVPRLRRALNVQARGT
jgi:phage tail P2-like protein